MKKIFLFSFLSVFLASCSLFNTDKPVDTNTDPKPIDESLKKVSCTSDQLYTSADFKFSINKCGSRVSESNGKDRIFFFFEGFEGQHRPLMIYAHHMKLDDYKKYYESQGKQEDGSVISKILSEKKTTIAGHVAYQFLGTAGGTENKLDIYLVIGSNYNYEIYFDASDDAHMKMLETLQIQ